MFTVPKRTLNRTDFGSHRKLDGKRKMKMSAKKERKRQIHKYLHLESVSSLRLCQFTDLESNRSTNHHQYTSFPLFIFLQIKNSDFCFSFRCLVSCGSFYFFCGVCRFIRGRVPFECIYIFVEYFNIIRKVLKIFFN